MSPPATSTRSRAGATSIAILLVLVLGLGSCAHGQGSTKAFCDHLRRLSNRSILLGRFDPSNPADLQVYRREAATEMSQLERAAPREIKPDVASVADLTAEVAQLTEKYQNDPGELQYRLFNLGRRARRRRLQRRQGVQLRQGQVRHRSQPPPPGLRQPG